MNDRLPALPIRSAQGEYSVQFVPTIASAVEAICALPNVVVIGDQRVTELYAEALTPVLMSRPCLLLEATEERKTPEGVLETWDFLLSANATRQTHVVVIGGGVIQDIAQFATHNYHRGLAWHFLPTTLLSMADSCIGAKCGINLGAYKNQLGVFHAPAHIWICSDFLDTLPETEVCSGYGEIVKLHLTRSGPDLFRELRDTVDLHGWRNKSLIEFIRRSLAVKKLVIEEDEYERGPRRVLNYGHTFGHALEAITRHAIPHGIAVAWGMDVVNFIALRSGLIPPSQFKEVHAFLLRHFGWNLPQQVGATQLIDATRRDKKNRDGLLTLVVPEHLGSLSIVQRAYDRQLTDLITEYLADHNVCSCA